MPPRTPLGPLSDPSSDPSRSPLGPLRSPPRTLLGPLSDPPPRARAGRLLRGQYAPQLRRPRRERQGPARRLPGQDKVDKEHRLHRRHAAVCRGASAAASAASTHLFTGRAHTPPPPPPPQGVPAVQEAVGRRLQARHPARRDQPARRVAAADGGDAPLGRGERLARGWAPRTDPAAARASQVSQVEQELACTEDHSSAVTEVLALLRKPSIADQNKLRLVLLYALRYEKEPSNRIDTFCDMLGADARQAVSQMLAHCGAAVRSGDLFSNKTWRARPSRLAPAPAPPSLPLVDDRCRSTPPPASRLPPPASRLPPPASSRLPPPPPPAASASRHPTPAPTRAPRPLPRLQARGDQEEPAAEHQGRAKRLHAALALPRADPRRAAQGHPHRDSATATRTRSPPAHARAGSAAEVAPAVGTRTSAASRRRPARSGERPSR